MGLKQAYKCLITFQAVQLYTNATMLQLKKVLLNKSWGEWEGREEGQGRAGWFCPGTVNFQSAVNGSPAPGDLCQLQLPGTCRCYLMHRRRDCAERLERRHSAEVIVVGPKHHMCSCKKEEEGVVGETDTQTRRRREDRAKEAATGQGTTTATECGKARKGFSPPSVWRDHSP